MVFPERFSTLPAPTWPRLRGLLDAVEPGGEVINMTIGEPQHAFPDSVAKILNAEMATFSKYPDNYGTPELLSAIAGWVALRFGVSLAPDQIMALNGTREGLYNAAMALSPETKAGARPTMLMPNPLYPVYGMAALSVGAEPVYVPATRETDHLPDFASVDPAILNRTTVVYTCSPANPQGAVADEGYWADLLALAEKYDFRVFADECYSEVYRNAPPPGALQMAQATGANPERVMIFHSLSKRSNLAGLRSGFCAGGRMSMARMRELRATAGAPLPGPVQAASAAVWSDEAHVEASRALYQEKYRIADKVFGDVPGYVPPPAGFFLWLPVEDGEAAAMTLWKETGVRVLPGAYLARDVETGNPGKEYIRVAMVAPKDDVRRGCEIIRNRIYG